MSAILAFALKHWRGIASVGAALAALWWASSLVLDIREAFSDRDRMRDELANVCGEVLEGWGEDDAARCATEVRSLGESLDDAEEKSTKAAQDAARLESRLADCWAARQILAEDKINVARERDAAIAHAGEVKQAYERRIAKILEDSEHARTWSRDSVPWDVHRWMFEHVNQATAGHHGDEDGR